MDITAMSFPPNMANPSVVGPLKDAQQVQQGLHDAGINPDDYPKWDWRDKYKLLPPSNQMQCGNCWAQSSTNALTDKFLIEKKLKGLELDQLVTTVCTPVANNKCGGGVPYYAGKFFEEYGGIQGDGPGCPPSWEDFCKQVNCMKTPIPLPACHMYKDCTKYKAKKGSTQQLTVPNDPKATIDHIKLAILTDGPVVATFKVWTDFQFGTSFFPKPNGNKYMWDATEGVYVQGSYAKDLDKLYNNLSSSSKSRIASMLGGQPDWNSPLEGGNAWHAVEVVGWNMNHKYPHWIVKNSWGDKWAEGGYWRHAMYPLNKNGGLDIPTTTTQGGLEGGCTNFKADIGTGGEYNKKVGKAKSGGESNKFIFSNKIWIILAIVLGSIILLGVVYYFLKRRKNVWHEDRYNRYS